MRLALLAAAGFTALLTSSAADLMAAEDCSEFYCVDLPGCTSQIYFTSCIQGTRTVQCCWTGCTDEDDNGCSGWHPCNGCTGGGCFLKGTPITMADGSKKSIESVSLGDRVLSYDESLGSTTIAEVTFVHPPREVDHYFVINGQIRISETQPLLIGGSWVKVGELKVGDFLTNAGGATSPVYSLRRVDEKANVYNFSVSMGTYIAHGVVAHNKHTYPLWPEGQ